jgi:hypothetical protein
VTPSPPLAALAAAALVAAAVAAFGAKKLEIAGWPAAVFLAFAAAVPVARVPLASCMSRADTYGGGSPRHGSRRRWVSYQARSLARTSATSPGGSAQSSTSGTGGGGGFNDDGDDDEDNGSAAGAFRAVGVPLIKEEAEAEAADETRATFTEAAAAGAAAAGPAASERLGGMKYDRWLWRLRL